MLELLGQHRAGRSGPTDACAARALPPQTPAPPALLAQETFWARPGGRYLRRHRCSGQGPSQAPSEGKHGAVSSAEKGSGRHSSLNSSFCVVLTGREQRLHYCGRPALGGSAPPPEREEGGAGRPVSRASSARRASEAFGVSSDPLRLFSKTFFSSASEVILELAGS